jgi:hypothetical protein
LSGGAAAANVAWEHQLTGMPTLAQDAATKNYVDTALNSSNVLASKNVFVGDINGEAAAVALSGDAAITNAGVVTIETDAVTTAKILDGTILAADIAADAVTTVKIADANVTAKIADANVTTESKDCRC